MFTFRIMNTDVKIIANFVKTRQGNDFRRSPSFNAPLPPYTFQLLYCKNA